MLLDAPSLTAKYSLCSVGCGFAAAPVLLSAFWAGMAEMLNANEYSRKVRINEEKKPTRIKAPKWKNKDAAGSYSDCRF
jgi:hypothetical protein